MLPPGVSRGFAGSSLTAAAVLTLSIDITSATAGEWVLCLLSLRNNVSALTLNGWTQIGTTASTAGTLTQATFVRRKVSGDTTFSINWTTSSTQGLALLQEYKGLDATSGFEGGNTTTFTAAGGVFPTPTLAPNAADRWAVGLWAIISGQSTNKTATNTFTGDMTNSVQSAANVNGTTLWANAVIADSNAVVSAATHSATDTTTNFAYGGGASQIVFLIPTELVFAGVQKLQAVNRAGVF